MTGVRSGDGGKKVERRGRRVRVPSEEIAIYTILFLTCNVSRVQRVTKIFALAAATTQNRKVRC